MLHRRNAYCSESLFYSGECGNLLTRHQFLNKLLEQAHSGSEELVPNSEHELSVVTAANDGSAGMLDGATVPPLDDSFKPFVASSLEDAARNVGGARYFAALDQQSATDDSAILVHHEKDGSLATARVTFKSVQSLLVALSVASIGFGEISDIANAEGGVYGATVKAPRKGAPAPRMRLGGS